MRKLFPHLMVPAAIAVIVGSGGGFAKLDGWLFWLAFSLPCGLVWYFESRQSRPASATETVLATAWKWLRRLLAFSCSLLLLAAAAASALGFVGGSVWQRVGFTLFSLLMAFSLAHFSWYGKLGKKTPLYQDREHYREQKKRYHWRK